MEETPLLTRHPLEQKKIAAKDVVPRSPVHESSGSETEGMASDEEEVEIPQTQEVDPRPLAGVMVFVDVRSGIDGCENRSQAISHELDNLGATVCARLTKDVTHVVFKDGRMTTKDKAEKKGMYLVSPLWVDACKRANDRVSEAKYPSLFKAGCDSPVVLGKIKRIKSMQPKPFEEEIAKSIERSRKRHKTDGDRSVTKSKRTKKLMLNDDGGSGLEEESESSFELPAVEFLRTPKNVNNDTSMEEASITPESVVQRESAMPKEQSEGSRKKEQKSSAKPQRGGVKAVSSTSRKRSITAVKAVESETRQARRQSRNKENEEVVGNVSGKMDVKASLSRTRRRRGTHRCTPFQTKPSIVLTSVEPKEQEIIFSIVEKLGKFEVTKTVCDATTHVVCGNPRRTINILSGTAMGCWILSLDWVWESLDSGKWVKEEPYEMSQHFPAARFFRLERLTAHGLYRPSLFVSAGCVFVSSDSRPPPQQLERLLALGGGKVTGSHRKADICIGCKSWSENVKSISEQWVLDSITEHQPLPLEDYLLDTPTNRATSPEL